MIGKELGVNASSDRARAEVEYQKVNRDVSHAWVGGDRADGGNCGRRGGEEGRSRYGIRFLPFPLLFAFLHVVDR